jgi:hypothetical protein
VNVSHFVPHDEIDVHDFTADCPCKPEQIPLERLEELNMPDLDVVYEHFPFSEFTDKTHYEIVEG